MQNAPAPAPAAAKRQPIPFGKYLLLDRINIGGMAEVWRGKMFGAGGFDRLVAIKRILPNIAEDDEFIKMFIDEAKISVQLTHANIAQIHDLGQISSSYFIAMEYIPGKDARAIFERCRKKGEPAPIPLSCYVISKLCEGLDYAHRKKDGMGRDMNIVHRDVSPQNVLVSFDGEVKVIDFGIAKAAGQATKTQAGILKGKFGYMSPEQIRGLPLDRRSDVFAIGICLYEMLTGERLFTGESDFSVLEKVRKAEVTPPSTYNRRIPPNLEKIVLKALSREVDTRYQYANELADDLQKFLISGESIFSRKDLVQYMKSMFPEEVDRERARTAEYAQIKAPEGMLAAIEAAASMGASKPAPGLTGKQPTAQFKASNQGSKPPAGSMPKLTAAAPVNLKEADTNEHTELANESDDSLKKTRAPPLESEPGTSPVNLKTVAPSIQPLVPTGESTGGKGWAPPNMARPRLSSDGFVPSELSTGQISLLTGPLAIFNRPLIALQSLPVMLGWVALTLVLAGAVAWQAANAYAARAPSGFVLVEVSPGTVKKARVWINGEDMGVMRESPELYKDVKAGPAMVVVTAEGYQTFAQGAQVKSGSQPSTVNVQLKREVLMAQLFVDTEPKDAEVSLNGDVRRKEGESGSVLIMEIPKGATSTIAVKKIGFRAWSGPVTAGASEDVVRKSVTLQPAEPMLTVSSEPQGAEIIVDGRPTKQMTPASYKLPSGAQKLELRKKCFAPQEITLDGTVDLSKPIHMKLIKLPSCR